MTTQNSNIAEFHTKVAADYNADVAARYSLAFDAWTELQNFMEDESVKAGYVLATRQGYLHMRSAAIICDSFIGCQIFETRAEAEDIAENWNRMMGGTAHATVLTHWQGYRFYVQKLVGSLTDRLSLIVK